MPPTNGAFQSTSSACGSWSTNWRATLITIPHVRRHFDALFIDFATAFRLDPARIEQEFGHIGGLEDLSKIQELSEQFNDPEAILAHANPDPRPAHAQLDALVAAFLGMVDFAVERVCLTLVPNHALIRQAMRERTPRGEPRRSVRSVFSSINITGRGHARSWPAFHQWHHRARR
ncbi:MAG: hypothetical protein R2710_02480 [Acidimicrobiales bacterium]